jgi:polyhydroxybutyrate depolymerase
MTHSVYALWSAAVVLLLACSDIADKGGSQGVAGSVAGFGANPSAGATSAAAANGGATSPLPAAGAAPVTRGAAPAGAMAAAGRGAMSGPGAAGQAAPGVAGQAAPGAAGQAAPIAGTGVSPSGDPMVQILNPPAKPSAGCGMPAPMAGMASIDVMGMSRDYIMTLPQSYDPSKPYKLIFAWHGLGGTAQQIASNWYGLSRMSQNGAIFVAGQGLETSNSVGSGPGWPNTNGQDVAFVKALYARLQSQVCFDENRVFSVGMSYGGIMSNTLGCQMGDVFRAIAPMSGSGPGFGGRATCVGQVAVWQSHGDNDTVVPTMSGEASRDFWVNANHCKMPPVSVDPSPCVAYPGCDADLPVTFCEFAGGHTVPPFAAAAIWKFFAQF